MRPTENLVVVAIASVLCWGAGMVLPSTAWAQTRPTEEAEQLRWSLSRGTIELGALIGGGFSTKEKTREDTEFAFLPRFGYAFAEQGHFLPGSFELVGEPMFLTVFQHQTVYVGGLAALLKYNFQTGTRWTPYLVGGGGVSFASHRLPHGGTNFNFVPEGGVGLQYAITPRSLLGVEWRFQHFSNADISPPNPSLNMSLFLLGFSVVY
jgi:opacity protein-like surface antigen